MRKSITGILFFLTVNLNGIAQSNRKAIGYSNAFDYERKQTAISFDYELAEMKSDFIPELFAVYSKGAEDTYGFFIKKVAIITDSNLVFINLRMLKMSRGFKRITDPRPFHFFIGKPLKPKSMEDGSIVMGMGLLPMAAAVTIDAATADYYTRAQAAYVFCLKNGRVHPFTVSTLERLLDDYPEVLKLYQLDPKQKELETMKRYLDILNDLIEIEQQE